MLASITLFFEVKLRTTPSAFDVLYKNGEYPPTTPSILLK